MCDAMMIPCHNKNFSLTSYVLLSLVVSNILVRILRSNFYDARVGEEKSHNCNLYDIVPVTTTAAFMVVSKYKKEKEMMII